MWNTVLFFVGSLIFLKNNHKPNSAPWSSEWALHQSQVLKKQKIRMLILKKKARKPQKRITFNDFGGKSWHIYSCIWLSSNVKVVRQELREQLKPLPNEATEECRKHISIFYHKTTQNVNIINITKRTHTWRRNLCESRAVFTSPVL